MSKNEIIELLGIRYPIIQAPMAGGVTTSELVAAVSNSGGLGMIGAGYMTPNQIREQIREVKKLTKKPFGVNLFVPVPYTVNGDVLIKTKQILHPIEKKLKVPAGELRIPNFQEDLEAFNRQIEVMVEEGIAVCSFTFGIPNKEILALLKQHSIAAIGTATTVEESLLVEKAGFDAVVVQGSEAGGHRGTFEQAASESLIGLMALIPQVFDNVVIPIIAAGGIMDGRGYAAAQCLGAQAVQMGTAFLACKESGANQEYKTAILHASEDSTRLTKSFSGKTARGISNQFFFEMNSFENSLPPYPVQNELTKGIRKQAAVEKNREYMSLWAGQGTRLSQAMSAEELVQKVLSEAEQTKAALLNQWVRYND